ncbi:MAG: KamA family radical SAM protein [Eubacteriales bacterium]|nr:KamA family radical SAM protein [Eubacteriales bacterium]
MDTTPRSQHLHEKIDDYLQALPHIRTGLNHADQIQVRQTSLRQKMNASQAQWDDYRWQLANRIDNVQDLRKYLPLDQTTLDEIAKVSQQYRFAISPYYLSLIDPEDPHCPIRRQAVPSIEEMNPEGVLDPMDEEHSSPVPGVTRRYPDRLIIKVTNLCGMYCRFCQRRRLIGEVDQSESDQVLQQAIQYIREQPEIRDVLITGGDALMLSDRVLDKLLTELHAIPHVEIVRLGTRTPVTLPQRITPELVAMLKRHHPLYVNTHFNSPAEITHEAKLACDRLADAGIPLGNQMVLLNGVNNHKFTVRRLNQLLLTLRVKPYYIFHPKTVRGTSHFWVRLEEGLEIMESLRGYTSGMAIPTYIVNGPGGLGKTPLIPNYLLYIGKDKAVFRNWENENFEIENNADRGI